MDFIKLSKEQEAVAKGIIARMEKAQIQEDDGVLDDMVFQMKANEARVILQQGLEEQVRYIVSRCGGDALAEQEGQVEELLMDFVPTGEVVECRDCRKHLFKDKATLEGQNWVCPKCVK